MVRTRVGYAGGTSCSPTYREIGDHSETVQIDFDPAQITYEELLEVFWASHNAAAEPWSRQYMSIIFYQSAGQKDLALASLQREEARSQGKVHTEIVEYDGFYLAEDYHQKYYLQMHPDLLDEFTAMYPEMGDLIRSTAAARVNGYLGGNGTRGSLQGQLDSLGLSQAGMERLLQIGRRLPADALVPYP